MSVKELMSFSHKLKLNYQDPTVKRVVEISFQDGGFLNPIYHLNEIGSLVLKDIGLIAPETLLNKIENEFFNFNVINSLTSIEFLQIEIINLIQHMAYEIKMFDRCMNLLINMSEHEHYKNIQGTIEGKIHKFFQPYLSGTYATLEQRLSIVINCLKSNSTERQDLGIILLAIALNGHQDCTKDSSNKFDLFPRNDGYQPNYRQLIKWYESFIDVVVQFADCPNLKDQVRQVLADNFLDLWDQEELQNKLVSVSDKLNADQYWSEGWKSVRAIIYLRHTKRKDLQEPKEIPQILIDLERKLRPNDLLSKIEVYIFGKNHDCYVLDLDYDHDNPNGFNESKERLNTNALKLGKKFAESSYELADLKYDLFANRYAPYRDLFGRGLAKKTYDLRKEWRNLIDRVNTSLNSSTNFSIIYGFIQETKFINLEIYEEFINDCKYHSKLYRIQ